VEVTRENLEQFNNYKNLNHQVIRGVTDVVNEFPEAFNTLMQSGEPTKAVALFDAVINTVILEQEGNAEAASIPAQVVEGEVAVPQDNPEIPTNPQAPVNPEIPASPQTTVNPEIPANNMAVNPDPDRIAQSDSAKSEVPTNAATPNDNQALNIQNRIIEMYTAARTPEAKAELFADKEFQNLVKEAIVNKWTLTPEAVTDKSNVEALYQRLRTGLSHLEIEARETAGTNAPITQAVTNLNNNIDFMNQLNHMYTYIQLPLKMQNGEQHGELFIYTNKHSLASKDGSVSAFLHLDMDNLGPVDCYVAMKDSKVNTNFRLKDDETLKFIEEHMDILNSRLEKRGYSLSAKCNLMDEETSGMEEILKTDNLKVFGGHHSFDVRT
ncbi:MAG: flagellar hook-length control protein FliK, partial [Lachnospiraceae bacterium]|nr:flagellar hook-length control protein FliK [Lachnospiraceae bacterium]